MNRNTTRQNLIIIVLIGIVTSAVLLYRSMEDESLNGENSGSSTSMASNDPSRDEPNRIIEREYADGQYSASGSYISPGGAEELEINLTLENDKIVEIEFIGLAELPASKFHQEKFAESYKDKVIGKNIKEVEIDKVAGSSLTPIGFNEAIGKIRNQARRQVQNSESS